MAVKTNFKGDDAIFKGSVRNLDGTQLPQPTDISGWTIVFTVRLNPTDATYVLQKTATIVDAPNGRYRIALTSDDTTIDAGDYVYDVWRTNAGFEEPIAYGTLTIKQDVRIP